MKTEEKYYFENDARAFGSLLPMLEKEDLQHLRVRGWLKEVRKLILKWEFAEKVPQIEIDDP